MSSLRLESIFIGGVLDGVSDTVRSHVRELPLGNNGFVLASGVLQLALFLGRDLVAGLVAETFPITTLMSGEIGEYSRVAVSVDPDVLKVALHDDGVLLVRGWRQGCGEGHQSEDGNYLQVETKFLFQRHHITTLLPTSSTHHFHFFVFSS